MVLAMKQITFLVPRGISKPEYVWQRLGLLDREHRDSGLARAVDDGRVVELAPLGIGDGPE